MLAVLSPAKALDFETPLSPDLTAPPLAERAGAQPRLLEDALELVKTARKLKAQDLKAMMGISDALADLNVARFKAFSTPFTPDNARPALFAFNGDVYGAFEVRSAKAETIASAQDRVRILSGLYGLLRPLDLIQPYRLEMGVSFATAKAKTLTGFWGNRITELLARDLEGHADQTLVNLASQEYFSAVRPRLLPGSVITPLFKERRGNKLQVISFFAKTARGRMARFLCDQRMDRPDGLKDFALDGYRYEPNLSNACTWVFVR